MLENPEQANLHGEEEFGSNFNPNGEKNRCLICYNYCHDDHVFSTVSFSEDSNVTECSLLSKHLEAYFILNRVFELPTEQLKTFLEQCPTSPENWLKICTACRTSYVEKCKEIFYQLLAIQERFNDAKKKLICAIKTSVINVERNSLDMNDPEKLAFDVTQETRRFVRDEKYSFIVDDVEMEMPSIENDLVRRKIMKEDTDDAHELSNEEIKNEHDSDFIDVDDEEPQPTDSKFDTSEEDDDKNKVSNDEHQDWNGCDSPFDNLSDASSDHEDESQENKIIPQKSPKKTVDNRYIKKDPHPCTICGYKCRNVQCLEKHMLKKHTPVDCTICHKRLLNHLQLYVHNRQVHNLQKKDNIYTCEQCGKTFRKYGTLHSHKAFLHTQPKFACSFPDCGKKFGAKHLLEYHERYHKPPTMACSICGKGYRFKRDLQRHESSHTNKITRPFMCDMCPERFPSRDNLRIHVRDKHQTTNKPDKEKAEEEQVCSKCGETFPGNLELHRHMKNVHYRKKIMVTCELCGKLVSSESMKSHKKYLHESPVQYACKMAGCKFKFRKEESLKLHMTKHDFLAEFKCKYCGIVVKYKKSLQSHVSKFHEKRESRPKPFRCEICDKEFIKKHGLVTHMKKLHKQNANVK